MASAVISSRGSGFNYAFLLLESKEEVEEAVDSFQGGGGESSVLLLPTTKEQVGWPIAYEVPAFGHIPYSYIQVRKIFPLILISIIS